MGKRLLGTLAAIVFAASTLTTGAFAAGPVPKIKEVVFEKGAITDNGVLRERAEKGISDPAPQRFKPLALLKNEQTGEVKEVKTIQTTQFLKHVKYSDGSDQKIYSTTVFTVKPLVSNSQPYNSNDPTYSVNAYSTFYWDETSGYMKLTSVSGGWTRLDSQVAITGQHVRYYANGTGTNGLGVTGQTQDEYPSGYYSFSYSAPTTWDSISTSATLGRAFGVNSWVKLSRGTSNWSFGLINSYDQRTTTDIYQ